MLKQVGAPTFMQKGGFQGIFSCFSVLLLPGSTFPLNILAATVSENISHCPSAESGIVSPNSDDRK